MESIQNFNKGMDLDTNPLNIEKGKYQEANNIRIVSDVSSTSFSVNNIKGNLNNITIPDTPDFISIKITDFNIAVQDLIITSVSSTITIAELGASFSTAGLTPESLYNYIVNDGAYSFLGTNYNIYVGASYLVIVPMPGWTVTASTTSTPTGLGINNTFVPAQTGMEIIGSANLRDDVYLFTTNSTAKNPGGHDASLTTDASSVGQIWKYTYDKITLAGTLTLIYNNYVDFTTYHAIPPSATTGRYENATTQRVYWTDNFNKLRTINVADPDAMAIDVSVLNSVALLDTDVPILQTISNTGGGTIKVGAYQAAYRLTNTGGGVGNFSELSNIVYVTTGDEGTSVNGDNFEKYYGGTTGSVVSKLITWKIDNIDQDFDRIEVAIVYRENATAPATVLLLPDAPLNNDSYEFSFDGSIDTIPMTLDEFLTSSTAFTHCKTIGTKDNRLFVGNVRNLLSEIEYDARAYRWWNPNSLQLTENGVITTPYYTLANIDTVVETSDAVNADQSINKYQSDGVTLGGEGVNIKYTFKTIAIAADQSGTAYGSEFSVPDCQGSPWRSPSPRWFGAPEIDLNVDSPTNTGTLASQLYPQPYNNSNDDFKYTHISGLLRGYQRTETYRFGIQFFDKSKNPYFVKWIGDITMPDFEDVNLKSYYEDGSATGINDFRLSFRANKNGTYWEEFVQSLGIEFTVLGLETISDKISGYSIVRTERTDADKTIVCQGYITPVDIAPLTPQFYSTTSPRQDPSGNIPLNSTYTTRGWLSTPELSHLSISPDETMKMRIKTLLGNVNFKTSNSTGGTDPYFMFKLYEPALGFGTAAEDIAQISYCGYGGETTDVSSGLLVGNYDYGDTAWGDAQTESCSIGNPAFYFRLDTYSIFWPGPSGKYLVNIERSLTNQYGGNLYTSRADSTYISCGHFRPIRETAAVITDVPSVFGGDIFVNMYDSCRWAKNFGSTGRGVASSGHKYSTTFYYPVESTINTGMRNGNYMNKDFSAGVSPCLSSYEVEFIETYDYNNIFSAENNVKKYYPKPDPFLLNEEFDNRFYASEIKINGEFADSWGMFKVNNYWDVEGTYGPINAMTILRDKMYFWQNRAFGIIQINPRSVVTDVNAATNAQLQIGTGLPLQRHDYLSTEIGLQHQWGMTKSSNKIYWADVANRKMFTYAEGQAISPESDVKGLFAFLTKNLKNNILTVDKPVYDDNLCTDISNATGVNGVRSVYDFKYNQAIFTFTDGINANEDIMCLVNQNNFTIAYDDNLNAFTAFYGYTPKIYFSDGYKIFSTDNYSGTGLSNIYMHDVGPYCEFYGVVNESTIRMVVNDNFQYTKAFDNIMYDSQATDINGVNYHDDTWNTLRVYNDHQNTDFQTLSLGTNLKRKERTYQLAIPRNRVLYSTSNSPDIMSDLSPVDKVMGERMRDKYIVIDLKYSNITNRNLAFNNLRTLFRPSIR